MAEYDRSLSDQELAKMWLGYSFGHEELEKEVTRRWPRLAGWKAAADHLYKLFWDQRRDQEGVDLNEVLGPDDPAPFGFDELMARYRSAVERIAAGE
jgi:hypothetical protein